MQRASKSACTWGTSPRGIFSFKNGCTIASLFRSCHAPNNARLPSSVKRTSPDSRRSNCPGPHHAVVHRRQHEAIRHDRPQLLHQVQRKRAPARPIGMHEPDIRIEPHAFERRRAIMCQHGVEQRQHGVHRVGRRPPHAPREPKRLLIPQDQLVEHAEVLCRRITLDAAQPVHRFARSRTAHRNVKPPRSGLHRIGRRCAARDRAPPSQAPSARCTASPQ